MKVFLLLFSLFFLVSAMNDCCLVELEEEVLKITKTDHSEDDHSEETESCEDCQCSTFCSYNIITVLNGASINAPDSYRIQTIFHTQPAKVKNIPDPIFHPPIA